MFFNEYYKKKKGRSPKTEPENSGNDQENACKAVSWDKLDGFRIGDYRIIVHDSDDHEISFGFSDFRAEFNYRISREGDLFVASLSADGAVEPFCITDDFTAALYAAFFFNRYNSNGKVYAAFRQKKPDRPYRFDETDDAAFYMTQKDSVIEVGLYTDGKYICKYTLSSPEKAEEEWAFLASELEDFCIIFDTFVQEDRIGAERKSEMLRTAFLGFSTIERQIT